MSTNETYLFTPYASEETDAAGIPRLTFDLTRAEMHIFAPPDWPRGLGYKGLVTDAATMTYWNVYGAPCWVPGCDCAATVKLATD